MSSLKDTKENILMAQFMGQGHWQCWKKNFYKPYWADKFPTKEECESTMKKFQKEWGLNFEEYEAKFIAPDYCNDWKLLMPVVEKIESFGLNFEISGASACIFYMGIENEYSQMTEAWDNLKKEESRRETKIEAVVNQCILFIEFYNTYNK